MVDQAELHGSSKNSSDLGMPLPSVNRVDAGQADMLGSK